MVDGNDGHREEGRQRQPPRPALVVRIFRALKRQRYRAKRRREKRSTEHQQNERMMARWTRRVGFFTLILTLTAVASDVIIYFTMRDAKEAAGNAHTDNVLALGAVTAAQKAASAENVISNKRQDELRDLNDRQTNAAERSLLLGNRAWIGPGVTSLAKLGNGGVYQATINIQNSGHTPGFKLRTKVILRTLNTNNLIYKNGSVFSKAKNPCADFRPSGAEQVIFPGQPLSIHASATNPGNAVFVEACIKYETMGKPQFAEICEYAIGFDNDGKEIPVETATLRFCANHNRAD